MEKEKGTIVSSPAKLSQPSPAKPKQSSGFLMSIVRTLSASTDFEQREKEKANIEKQFKHSDQILGVLVKDNYQDLQCILTAFIKISDKINESRDKIKKIKQDLSSCKTLLHCKRDELRRLWIEGVEQKTISSLLDQIEQVKNTPSKLDTFLEKRQYLQATDLIVSAVTKLETNLSAVEALRDLKVEILFRKEKMHEILINELNRQIYTATSQAMQQKTGSGRRNEMTPRNVIESGSQKIMEFHKIVLAKATPQLLGELDPTTLLDYLMEKEVLPYRVVIEIQDLTTTIEKTHKIIDQFKTKDQNSYNILKQCLIESNQKHLADYLTRLEVDAKQKQEGSSSVKTIPLLDNITLGTEDDSQKCISNMLESLFILRKVPEAAEAIKLRMHSELIAIVARASHQVVDSAGNHGENMMTQSQPRLLLELLEIVFHQFQCVATIHKIVLNNLQRIISSGVYVKSEYMYTMKDVWSEIQAVLQLMLHEYLDVKNTEKSRQQITSTFDEPNMDIGVYFAKKKSSKPKKVPLFRFDASIHALSTNSYVEDTRHFDSELFGNGTVVPMGALKHVFVCKPSVDNIKGIFKPLQSFIREIEVKSELKARTSSLHEFLEEFVEKIYLGHVHYVVSNSISLATKGFDALRNVVDHKTQKELGVLRPLLQSTVTVDKSVLELKELMVELPDYADKFLDMICKVLREYRDTCHSAYRGIVQQYDAEEKRVISATWAKDEDISRFLRSLPSWRTLQPTNDQELNRTVCSEEEMRALNSKEAIILITNLSTEEAFIPQHEIITDVTQMRTVANVHESLEWFSTRLKNFSLTKSNQAMQHLTVDSPLYYDVPNVSAATLESLNNLVKDFQELTEICLLLLHLEVRVHCFYYLMPVAKQSNYAGPIDDLDPDSNVLKLNKDLSNMEEVLSQSLQPKKFKYIFESLGYLVASILMNSMQFIKKINENGIKKMCRNLFAIQQNLINITMSRESDLDHARQYYELLYLTPEKILASITEKGAQFTYSEYEQLLQLYCRSHAGCNMDENSKRLKDVMEKGQNE